MAKPYLSVIAPSYNEMKNLKKHALEHMYSYLSKQSYEWELLLSDDGSTDGTTQALIEFANRDERIRVVQNPHAGKAPTVRSGMLAARGEWRLFTDFDQSTPLSEVEKLLHAGKEGNDVVIGSREIVGATREKEPFHRHVMGRGFNLLVQLLAIPGILDTQCGFKLFSQKATELLFSHLYVYGGSEVRKDAFTGAFDVELLYLAKKAGFSIVEVPIVWEHRESQRVNPIKDSLRMLRDIIMIRLASVRGVYSTVKSYHSTHGE